jgi:hypothetical protein
LDDDDDSIPVIEIDAEPTGEAGSSGRRSRSQTMPHATVDWMLGFDQGRQRGSAEVLEALEASLEAVGVGPDVARTIVARVRALADKPDKR